MPDIGKLLELGYSPRWQALCEPHAAAGLMPARVLRTDRGSALLATASGIVRGQPAVRLLKAARGPGDLPAVGDWVAVLAPADLEVPLIEAVLERDSALTRGGAGRTSELQVLAANVDLVFVVHPIDGPPNLRRIERELALAWDSGATPVVVLTKADLAADPEGAQAAVESVALGCDVLVTAALTGEEGVRPLLSRLTARRTAVLIGPSGAGKSTLINALLGEERQATREVRLSDGRGRHTTVARELVQMQGGGLLIDSPGLRELGLTGSEEGISSAFADIDRIARSCRFRDCRHGEEPDCAVRSAVEAGAIPAERVASYRKLRRETQLAATRTDARVRAEEERKRKILSKAVKNYFKQTGHR